MVFGLASDPRELAFGAAMVRFLVAFIAFSVFPLVYPAMAAHRWVFVAYAAVAAFAQFMIWKDIGGKGRVIIAGILDMAFITFIVQRLGTGQTMLVSFYFIAGILNAVVVGPFMGIALAIIAAIMYSAVVLLETQAVLPYAPDVGIDLHEFAPTFFQGAINAGVMGLMLIVSTAIVGILAKRNLDREQQLLEANQRLADLTRQDPLTKLCNRRHILQQIEEGLAWLKRGRPMSVVMLDLDDFKRINDAKGHLEGDELLRLVAGALKRCTREVDMAGRYGGDEFVIVLPDTDREQGLIAAKRFVHAVRRVGLSFDPQHPVTASAGLTVAHEGDTVNSVLRRADQQAYAAKNQGGDCVQG